MSPLTYILPALTLVSLFFYIFSAERAWLPKKGTTEWIMRTVTPKRMTAQLNGSFSWKDLLIFLALVLVYSCVLVLSDFASHSGNAVSIVSAAVSVGIIYLSAQLIFNNRVSAFFAAVITAADITILQPFAASSVLSVLLAVFVFFVLLSSQKLIALLPAGLFLAAAMLIEPESLLFTLLPLVSAVVMCAAEKKAKPVLLYLLCCVLLPAAVFCGVSYFVYGDIILVRICTSFVPPLTVSIQYLAVCAVMFILLIIHIFKDKSFTALFVSVGAVLCAALILFRLQLLPLFAGFMIAYFADIIIKRGKTSHRVFCIIFGIVMLLPLVFSVLSAYIL